MLWFVLLIGVIALLIAGWRLSNKVIYPRVYAVEDTYRLEVENGKLDPQAFAALPKQEVHLVSPYGYSLYGLYIPSPGARRTVVLVHGITWSLYGMVKYVQLFRGRGFNVLMYDQRNHGRSGGHNTTFGYYEKYDLQVVVDWALKQLGAGGAVGTMGESLGGATVLQHAAIDPRLSFVLADCPYSDLYAQLAYRLRVQYHLPPFPWMQLSNLFSWLRSGLRYSKVSPIRDLQHAAVPILFAHGQTDTYILPQMSVDMAQVAREGWSMLYLAPNATHAQAFWNNKVEYDQKVGEFLARVFADDDLRRPTQPAAAQPD